MAAAVNPVLLYLRDAWPGWHTVPFQKDDTTLVIGAVNASIIAGFVANLHYVVTTVLRVLLVLGIVGSGVGIVSALVRLVTGR